MRKQPLGVCRYGKDFAMKLSASLCILVFASAQVRSEEPTSGATVQVPSVTAEFKKQLIQLDGQIERSPNKSMLYFSRAQLKSENGQFLDAISDLTKFIRLRPLEPRAFVSRAVLYQTIGEENLALSDFSTAVSLYSDRILERPPTSPEIYLERAEALTSLGKYEEAIEDIGHAEDLAPGDIRSVLAKINILKLKKAYDEAIEEIDKRLITDPTNVLLLNQRASMWGRKLEYRKSLDDLTKCINLNPPGELAWIVYVNRAKASCELGRLDSAIEDCTTAVGIAPRCAFVFFERASVLRRAGNRSGALSDFNEAIKLSPLFADAFRERANVLFDKGESERALEDFKQALRIKPSCAKCLSDYATFLALCPDTQYKDIDRAMALAEKGCEKSNWKDDRPLEALAIANGAANNFVRAKKLLQRAIDLEPEANSEERLKMMESFNRCEPFLKRTATASD